MRQRFGRQAPANEQSSRGRKDLSTVSSHHDTDATSAEVDEVGLAAWLEGLDRLAPSEAWSLPGLSRSELRALRSVADEYAGPPRLSDRQP
jgi:hypothetical protein